MLETSASSRFGVGEAPAPSSSAGVEWSRLGSSGIDPFPDAGSRRPADADPGGPSGEQDGSRDGAEAARRSRSARKGAEANDGFRMRVAEDSERRQDDLRQMGILSGSKPHRGPSPDAAPRVAAFLGTAGSAGIQEAPGTDIGDDSPSDALGIEEAARRAAAERLAHPAASEAARGSSAAVSSERLAQARGAARTEEASGGMARLRAKVRAMRVAQKMGERAAEKAGAGGKVAAVLSPAKTALWPLAALGAAVVLMVVVFFGFSSCAGMLGGIDASEEDDVGALTGNEAEIAQFLLDKGYDEIHVAAIMGNMRAEAGGTPGMDFDTGSVEIGSGAGHGICQWTGSRWDGPGGLLDFAQSQGKEWTDLQVQLDFLWTELQANWIGGYTVSQGSDDPPYPTSVYGSRTRFEQASELEEAVESFCYGFERPGIPHISRRIEYARQYLDMMRSDSPSTDAQRRVVEAAKSTPFAGSNLCATWVSRVYANAGFPYLYYQAPEWLASWCTSTDRAELKPGMVVAVRHSPFGSAGWEYGHVGIYIGDGLVMHNANTVQTTPIDEWIATYAYQCEAHWGWPYGDLSQE